MNDVTVEVQPSGTVFVPEFYAAAIAVPDRRAAGGLLIDDMRAARALAIAILRKSTPESRWGDLIEAIAILSRFGDALPTHCEHDTLTVMADPTWFSDDEIERLDELGFKPTEYRTFESARFGSA